MLIKKVPASRGAAWINASIGFLKTGGTSVWTPVLVVGLLGALPILGALLGLLIIFFYAGLILAFNQPGGSYHVFSGFKNGTFTRLLPILLLNVALGILAIIAMWPTLAPIIEAGMHGAKLSEEQAIEAMKNFGKQLFWLIPVSIVISWITQFAVPLVSLSKLSGAAAIAHAVRAIKINLSALLVNFLCLFIVVVLVSIAVMLPMMLLSALLASKPLLLNLAIIPFTALLTAAMVALISGNMLFSYRDVFDAPLPDTTKDNVVLV
jgi:hypothetical protein